MHNLSRDLAVANGNLMAKMARLQDPLDWSELERLSKRNQEICDRILFLYPRDGTLDYYHAIACNNLAACYDKQKKSRSTILPLLSQAHASMARAIEYKLDVHFGDEKSLKTEFLTLSLGLEDELRQSGRIKEADNLATRTRQFWKGDPSLIFTAACVWADSLRFADNQARKDLYVQLCLDALKEAVSSGLDDPSRLLNEKRLDPVRSSPGFQELVRNLKAKASPPEKKEVRIEATGLPFDGIRKEVKK